MWATFLEAAMILLFGISWPFNVIKSFRARSTKGKSLLFLILIFSGYICGIVSKIILSANGEFFNSWIQYLLFCFYVFNLLMISLDLILYVRNKRLDKINEAK